MLPTPFNSLAKSRQSLLALSLSTLTTVVGFAQATDDKPESKDESATILLSPFNVDTTQDRGYRATNTLAGSRINTQLRDLASPISVVTKDFMDDIGATDVNDILAYQAGSEGTRDFTSISSNLGRSADNTAQDPNSSTRGRGLAAYDVTRDYFYSLAVSGFSSLSTGTSVGFDAYNLDSVTISRGPNSTLAGLGSPAGIINYSPQAATFGKPKTEVTYRYGSYGDQRATLNSNIVASKDVLAFRVAGEWSDKAFQQKPAYDQDKRYYLAATWKPFSSTAVHVSYEAVRVHQDLPNSLTPEDDITQWLQQGKPSSTGSGGTLLFSGQGGGQPTILYNPDGSVYKAFNNGSQYSFLQQNLNNVGLWQPIRFANNQYGNWQELNTSASNALQRLNTLSASIDQQILPGLALNVGVVREVLHSNQINLFRPDYVSYQVDVNKTLPTGAANPYYGNTFMYFRGLDNAQNTYATNEIGRATLTYDLDLNKQNPWYGRYQFTGFLEHRRTESDFNDYNAQSTDKGTSYFQGETGRLFYLGGNASNGYKAQTVPRTPTLATGQAYLNPDGTIGSLSDSYQLKSDSRSITKLGTSAVIFQGYLLKDMIVPTVGIRRDVDRAGFSGNSTPSASTGIVSPAADYGPLTSLAQTTKSYGVVVHPLKWLSVFYNHSQNFIPNAGSVDLLGASAANPTGTSKDYGFAVDLLENKLSVKIDWYQTDAAHSPDSAVNFPLVQWSLPFVEQGAFGAPGPFADLAQQAGIAYKPGLAPGLATGDPRLANAYSADTTSRGLEVELTYNVTKDWRIFASVSKEEAKQTNIASSLTTFINQRLAYWQTKLPDGSQPMWTGKTTTKDWSGQPETGQQVFNNDILGPFIAYQAADGQPSTQLHKWKASAVTNYSFSSGPLKGFNAGTGLRYLDKSVIGNPAIYSLVNGTQTVTGLDLAHPYYSPATIGVDAWIGYHRKIFANRYLLSFQLNGRDLQENGGYRPIAANSDGSHAVFAIIHPRTYYLTTKLDF